MFDRFLWYSTKKGITMMRYLVLTLGLVCSLSGAVIRITDAWRDGQSLRAFHDQHRGTKDFIDMKQLDKKQRDPLWNFFKTLGTQKKTPTLMLLELSRSERAKLAHMDKKTYEHKSFRKQLGYHFVKGKNRWGSVIVDTWDERDIEQRQVSWALANTIDTLVQVYQKYYGCKAETQCLRWFDENASEEFFKDQSASSFHGSLRNTIVRALQGKQLNQKEKSMGFWSVATVTIKEYLASLERFQAILSELEQEQDIPRTIIQKLTDDFRATVKRIQALIDDYHATIGRNLIKATINDLILHYLMQPKSMQTFDKKVYGPFSLISVILGDITMIKKVTEGLGRYDLVIVYAGDNHMRILIHYLNEKDFILNSKSVLKKSWQNPKEFQARLMKLP